MKDVYQPLLYSSPEEEIHAVELFLANAKNEKQMYLSKAAFMPQDIESNISILEERLKNLRRFIH